MVVMICNDINPYPELSLWWSLIVTIRNVDIAVNNEPVLPMLLGALATAKTISRPTELIHLRDLGRINKLYYVFESTNHQPTDAQPSRSTWQWKNPTNTGTLRCAGDSIQPTVKISAPTKASVFIDCWNCLFRCLQTWFLHAFWGLFNTV